MKISPSIKFPEIWYIFIYENVAEFDKNPAADWHVKENKILQPCELNEMHSLQ